jgi:phosphatidylglycerophosphate synthase
MIIEDLKHFLEKIDHYRGEALFIFIKPYWPRKITPNQISFLRVIIGIALFILLFFFNINDNLLIISLFCFGALSDLIDGSVARGLNMVTDFGAMLDPIADRLIILPIAIYSLHDNHKWLLLILLLIEVVSALISLFTRSKIPSSKANIFGKTRMVLLSVVFAAILIVWPEEPPILFIDIIWVSIIFSFLSIFLKIMELQKMGHIKNKFINKKINENL